MEPVIDLTPEAKARLETCHPALKAVIYRACELSPIPFTVLCGHRNQQDQEAAFAAGTTKLHWPNGNHNAEPSNAVDLAPLPIDWKNLHAFAMLAGVVLSSARLLGVKLGWGGDWVTFKDYPHFELIKE